MSRLFETIKVKNRQPLHVAFHNARMNRARKALFGIEKSIDLNREIHIPDELSDEIYKCRVIYDRVILKIEFEKHTPREIKTLKVITCNHIDYHFKYINRSHLQELFEQRENCDDVLIIKNDLVTDTSFSNIVFWDGEQWITPSTPLLEGTARDRLIKAGSVHARIIKQDELKTFTRVRIINAMTDFDDQHDVKLVF